MCAQKSFVAFWSITSFTTTFGTLRGATWRISRVGALVHPVVCDGFWCGGVGSHDERARCNLQSSQLVHVSPGSCILSSFTISVSGDAARK